MKLIYVALLGFFLVLPFMFQAAKADSLKVNNGLNLSEIFPDLKIDSQFDKPLAIENTTQQVLFAASKSASDILNRFLEKQSDQWLQETHRVYIADIHKMPKMISRMVALPKMKKLPYPIFLGREAGDTAILPQQDGCITAIYLETKKIISIDYACSESEINQMLLTAHE